MKKFSKILALLIAAVMIFSLAACQTKPTEPVKPDETTAAPTTAKPDETTPAPETEPPVTEPEYKDEPFADNLPTAPTTTTPLVVAYSPFSAKFSPYFADTAYDQDVVGMTQLGLMTTDRMGGIIYNAIEGETVRYNGTDYEYKGTSNISVDFDEAANQTTYTARLRVGMKFSDGVEVTADDIIFTYYTLLDPSYTGSTTLSSYKIIGLKNYQTQTSDEVYEKYTKMVEEMYKAGHKNYQANDLYTEELYNAYWEKMDGRGLEATQAIVDYCMANYNSDAVVQKYVNPELTAEDVSANEGLQVALGMGAWGFGKPTEDGQFKDALGNVYDLKETFPTIENYYEAIYGNYEGDLVTAWDTEKAADTDATIPADTNAWFILEYGSKDAAMGGQGVPNIAGIKKLDKYTVQVVTEGYEAPAVYSILGISVTPMHYYGDPAKYDYENNKFGFDFNDLSLQKSKIEKPLGGGPYKFVSYENKVVTFEANENYYRGCPKIAEVQFKETKSDEVATAVSTGDVDAGEMTGSKTRFKEVGDINGTGEITGDVITTSKVDNLGYGYIGMNADTVNVNGDPDSDESKAFRKAIATVLAVFRDVAYDSYYGEAASVVQYPISNTSWAAPQATDDGYKVAFSVDAEGNDLYTEGMTEDEKAEAAVKGALTWFEKAGYTVADGKITAAPEGGKLKLTATIPGDGTGDHPSFTVLTMARDALESIGFELKIDDLANSSVLWDMLDAGSQEIWCAAWGSTIDPDMYQVYHSSGIVGRGGSDSNHYHIDDANLDKLIVDARLSDDQSYRKQVYKQCLDIIIDWAVEIPAYQRQNCIIFSTQRINLDTLTPDITTFWGWMNDIELLDMN